MAGFGVQQSPFMYPGVYSPGQVGFNNNPEMSQLISMFSGAVLNKYMGPGNFVPHMMPTQQLMDQFAMRNYQDQTRAASMAVANDNTDAVAQRLLGIRSAFTNEGPSELNREQAANMARMLNNPFTKMIAGQIMGPELLESVLHGSKGDITSLNNTISRIGYFRHDPTGPGRMDADSIADFSRGVYAHMYESQGNLEEIEQVARDTTAPTHMSARRRLLTAARQENDTIIEDQDVATRLEQMEDAPKRIETLYKKYVSGGKATDTKQQAQELVKFERAIQEAGVLGESETTIGGLVSKAERRATEEMHGFMAGQAGQIAENMFQRGMLPKEIGRMTAADRARLINQTDIDADTETRLSKEMARRDLSDQTNSSEMARRFRSLQTEPERERFIADEKNLSIYRDKLKSTRDEVKATVEGTGSLSATELEKLQGFDALAGNVDAKRSAEAIKKYTGAVDAIRDIFGDNGNPNAPLPALLAALEGLTGGAVGSMKPQKIEATLRQMQTLAKQAGVGFEQMAAMSTQIDSVGQSIGLTPADTLKLKPAAIAAVRAMQETGSFSNPIYGQVDKGTATQQVATLMTAGMGSKGNKAMAALATIYRADKARFADTELEAALEQAYNNPEGDGTYVYRGEKKNLREMIARQGEAGALGLFQRSSGTAEEFSAQRLNPLAMENADEFFGFLMQKDDEITVMNNNSVRGRLQKRLEQTKLFNGMSDDARADVSQRLGRALTERIFDTSGLEQEEQIAEIQKTIEADFTKVFQEELKLPEAQARAMAQEAAKAVSSNSDIQTYVGGANTTFSLWTGKNLRNEHQLRGEARDILTAQTATRSKAQAERRMLAGLGYETGPAQNISDYLLDLGKRGENFTRDGFMQSIARVTSNKEIMERYAPDMQGAFSILAEMSYGDEKKGTTGVLVGERDVKAAIAAATAGDATDLNQLAGIDPAKTTVITNEEADKLRDKKIADQLSTPEKLLKTYQQYYKNAAGLSADKLTDADKKRLQDDLRSNADFMREMEVIALGPGKMSARTREEAARAQIGSVKTGQEMAARDMFSMQSGLLEGQTPEKLKQGMDAAIARMGVTATPEQKEAIFAALSRGVSGKDALATALSSVAIPTAKKEEFTEMMRGLQAGHDAAFAETTGINSIITGAREKELAARFSSSGVLSREAAQQKAQETTEAIRQAQATAKTEEEKTQAAQKVTEDSLTQHYIDTEKLSEPEARAKAQAESRALAQKTDAATEAARAAGVAQRVDTLEVNAQTVVIKGSKFEGEKPAPQTPSATSPLAAAAAALGGDGASLMDAVTQGNPGALLNSVGGLETITSVATGDYLGAAMGAFKKMSLGTLFGKTEEGKKDEPKADAPLAAKPEPPPAPPAPEPEKVAQANETQMQHNAGATDKPSPVENKDRIAAIERQTREVIESASKNDQLIMLPELEYARAQKALQKAQEKGDAAAAEDAEKVIDFAKKDIISKRTAARMGIKLRGDESITETTAELNGVLYEQHQLGDHVLNPDIFAEESSKFDSAEQAGESPLSANAQKVMQLAQQVRDIEAGKEPTPLSATGPAGEEKRYTADELAALHPKGVKDALGREQPWLPAVADRRQMRAAPAPGIPEYDENGELIGIKENPEAKKWDRYGNPAGGTYAADGTSYTAPASALDPNVPPVVSQTASAGEKTPPSDHAQLAATGMTATEPKLNKEQQRLQQLFKTRHDGLAELKGYKKPNESAIKTLEEEADDTVKLLGIHSAAQIAGIDTSKGALWDQNAGTINGETISREQVEEQIALMRERAKTDPQSLMPKSTVSQLNDTKLMETAGVTSANVDPAAAQSAQKTETPKQASTETIVPDAQEKTTDANVQKPLAATLPNTETIKPETVATNRVQAMSASDIYGGGIAGAASMPTAGGAAAKMTIDGTLTLSGLQEAILSAQGGQVMQTEGGPPVVIDPTMQQRTNAPSKTWG